jgi:plasmid stability protein
MAVLNVRNLPDEVHARLRLRAAKAGRSMEAEARAILTDACSEESGQSTALSVTLSLPAWVDSVFGAGKPTDVAAELIAERRVEAARE